MEMPVSIEAEIAAVEGGKRMSNELQRALAEASMNMMNQLRPETMDSYEVDGKMIPMTKEQYGTEMQSGNITPNMTDAQKRIMQEEAFNKRVMDQQVMPSAQGIYGRSSGVTVDPSAAPMTSPRPPARPMK
jgi:hypothetical protein